MFGNRQPAPTSRIDGLRQVPIFADLSEAALAQIDSSTTEIRFPIGAELARENEFGGEAFIIVEGVAEIRIGGRTIGSAGQGDLIGEIALLDHGVRTATVVAATPMRVWVLDPREFGTLFEDPRSARRIAALVAARLRTRAELAPASAA